MKLKAQNLEDMHRELCALSLASPGKWVYGWTEFDTAHARIVNRAAQVELSTAWPNVYRDGKLEREPKSWTSAHIEFMNRCCNR